MSYGAFTDRVNKPSDEEVARLLGDRRKDWAEIDSYLTDTIKAKPAYKFYGRNYGWARGYSKSNRSIIALYPLSDDFTIQLIVKRHHETAIKKIVTSRKLLDLIKNTPEIHEGKWIFVRYSSINSVAVVRDLIDIRLQ